MGHTTEQARTLGALIEERRVSLGLTKSEAARRAGVTRQTWHQIEAGGRANMQPETMGLVDAALGWTPGTVHGLLRENAVDLDHNPDSVAVRKIISRVTTLNADQLTEVLSFIEALDPKGVSMKQYVDTAIEQKIAKLFVEGFPGVVVERHRSA